MNYGPLEYKSFHVKFFIVSSIFHISTKMSNVDVFTAGRKYTFRLALQVHSACLKGYIGRRNNVGSEMDKKSGEMELGHWKRKNLWILASTAKNKGAAFLPERSH